MALTLLSRGNLKEKKKKQKKKILLWKANFLDLYF